MNEVTQVHLGRQPFTVSVAAHKALKTYLHDITERAGKDVAEEVELRMAELLTERGITGDKVVLEKDVEYLQEQLGSPKDFAEDDDKTPKRSSSSEQPKRLFRDMDNAMVGGVAAGLGAFFNVDPVFIRILFVLALVTGGWGVAVYIVLWLLVPEAKTSSDRLQMHGKAVTLDTIKDAVSNADIPAAARRTQTLMGKIITVIVRIILGIVGVSLIIAAVCTLFAAVAGSIYAVGHRGQVSGQNIFPVGTSEVILLLCAMAVMATLSVMLLFIGTAMVNLRWKVPGWLMAVLAGLLIVTGGATAALGVDAAPRIQKRFDALHHSQVVKLPVFKQLEIVGDSARYTFQPDTSYYAELRYVGDPAKVHIPTAVKDGVLRLDMSSITNQELCHFFCLYNNHDLRVVIHAPAIDAITVDSSDVGFEVITALRQDSLRIVANKEAHVHFNYINPAVAQVRDDGSAWVIQLNGLRKDAYASDMLTTVEEGVLLSRAGEVDFDTGRTCDQGDPVLTLFSMPTVFKVNGQGISDQQEFRRLQLDDGSAYNCVILPYR